MKKIWFITAVITIGVSISFFQKSDYLNSTRTPSSDIANNQITPIILNLKNIKSAANVESTINETIKDLGALESNDEAKYLIQFLNIVKDSKGLIESIRPVLEDNAVTSNLSLNFLKLTKQQIPQESVQLNALFDYLLVSNSNQKIYSNISDIQNDLIAVTIPKLIKLHKDINASLSNYPAEDAPVELFYIDIYSLLGNKSRFLPDNFKNFIVTSAHLHIVKAELEKLISSIYYVSSYELDQSPDLVATSISKIAKKSFFSGITKKQSLESSNKLTLKLLHNQASKNKYKNLLTINEIATEKDYLVSSKNWLIRSFHSQISATMAIHQLDDNSQPVINLNYLKNRYSKTSLSYVEESIENFTSTKEVNFISPLNGQTFMINPSIIFDKSTMKDLKVFLPTGYQSQKIKTVMGQSIINLDYGKPNSWQDPSFAGLLPNTSNDELENKTIALILHPSTTMIGLWLKAFQ